MITWKWGIFLVVVSCVISIFLTPWAARLAVRADALDRPTHRKRHGRIVPLWGGLSLWLSVMLTVLVGIVISPVFRKLLMIRKGWFGWLLGGFLLGGTFITAVGMADDHWGIPPKLKLLGQCVVAGITVWFGIRVLGFIHPFDHHYVKLPFLVGGILAFGWIVLMMNAVNFIDGLDGLAAGTALISCAAFLTVCLLTRQVSTGWASVSLDLAAWLSLILAGSVAGFLVFNFHPARIFLGDSGSLFLGYALACIALIGSLKSTAVFTTVLPVLIMAIPLADVLWAIVRRIRQGQPISKGDKGHVHHRLLALGWSHRQVVLALYAFNAACGGLAIWLAR